MVIRKFLFGGNQPAETVNVQERRVTPIDPSPQHRVAFQGEPGAYSYEAARKYFGVQVQFHPCSTFEAVCEAVVAEQVRYGVLPIANSQTGRMMEIEQLVAYFPVTIVGKVDLAVNHCLLSLPGQRVSDIVIVISHPQALAQCSQYLEQLQAQVTPMPNTAASAKMISEKQLKGFAAIASMSAAQFYHLDVLVHAIQNTHDNTTRFVIIQKVTL
jgi:prephenate dehydratase